MTQQINLIDRSVQQGRDWVSGAGVAAVLGLSSVLVAGHYIHERLQWERAVALTAQAEAANTASSEALQAINAQLEEAQSQSNAATQLHQAALALLDPPRDCAKRLQQMVAAMPASMWLHEVEFAGARGLKLAASSLQPGDVDAYVGRLGSDAAFGGLEVMSLNVERQQATSEQRPDEGELAPAARVSYRFELSSLPQAHDSGVTR